MPFQVLAVQQDNAIAPQPPSVPCALLEPRSAKGLLSDNGAGPLLRLQKFSPERIPQALGALTHFILITTL